MDRKIGRIIPTFALLSFLLSSCSSLSAPLIAKPFPTQKIQAKILDSIEPQHEIAEVPIETTVQVESTEGKIQTYILNINTKKMHTPGCASISDIKEKNRRDFTGTREEAIAEGFTPCKRCNP